MAIGPVSGGVTVDWAPARIIRRRWSAPVARPPALRHTVRCCLPNRPPFSRVEQGAARADLPACRGLSSRRDERSFMTVLRQLSAGGLVCVTAVLFAPRLSAAERLAAPDGHPVV